MTKVAQQKISDAFREFSSEVNHMTSHFERQDYAMRFLLNALARAKAYTDRGGMVPRIQMDVEGGALTEVFAEVGQEHMEVHHEPEPMPNFLDSKEAPPPITREVETYEWNKSLKKALEDIKTG